MDAFFSANRQALQIPSSLKTMVGFGCPGRLWNSTTELGRWLEMTQRLQKRTSAGKP
jgi:hypothetical protein